MSESFNTTAAERIIGLRVVSNSVKAYKSKLNVIKRFFISNNIENTLEEYGEIRNPIDFNVIKQFFGSLSTNTDLPKRKYSQINNNISTEVEESNNEIEVNNYNDDESDSGNLINNTNNAFNNDIFNEYKILNSTNII